MNQRPILIYGRVEGGVSLAPAKRRRTLQACFFSPLVTHHCLRGGEEKSLAAVAANRNNPTFKNRRNPMKTRQKTFSNRNKNTTPAFAFLRPTRFPPPGLQCRPRTRLSRRGATLIPPSLKPAVYSICLILGIA